MASPVEWDLLLYLWSHSKRINLWRSKRRPWNPECSPFRKNWRQAASSLNWQQSKARWRGYPEFPPCHLSIYSLLLARSKGASQRISRSARQGNVLNEVWFRVSLEKSLNSFYDQLSVLEGLMALWNKWTEATCNLPKMPFNDRESTCKGSVSDFLQGQVRS